MSKFMQLLQDPKPPVICRTIRFIPFDNRYNRDFTKAYSSMVNVIQNLSDQLSRETIFVLKSVFDRTL